MKSETRFVEMKVKEAFLELKDSKTEDQELYSWIDNAMNLIEQNAFCGVHVPKSLWPKEYVVKYNIDNLWKYNLPDGWRLMYTIANNKINVLSIILEWLDHKNYERRFKY